MSTYNFKCSHEHATDIRFIELKLIYLGYYSNFAQGQLGRKLDFALHWPRVTGLSGSKWKWNDDEDISLTDIFQDNLHNPVPECLHSGFY